MAILWVLGLSGAVIGLLIWLWAEPVAPQIDPETADSFAPLPDENTRMPP